MDICYLKVMILYIPCLSGGAGEAPRWPLSGSEDKDETNPGKGFRRGVMPDATRSVKECSAKRHGVRVGEWRQWNEKTMRG